MLNVHTSLCEERQSTPHSLPLTLQKKYESMESTFIYQKNIMAKMSDERMRMIKKLDHAVFVEGSPLLFGDLLVISCTSLLNPINLSRS